MIADALARYPQWTSSSSAGTRGTTLHGEIKIVDSRGGSNLFSVEVFVPQRFPEAGAHPSAKLLEHDLGCKLTVDAHVGEDGTMCIQLNERNEINYPRDGLIRFLEHVELHLYRARIWSILGEYPGPEYAHYEDGKIEYAAEIPNLREPFEQLRIGIPAELAALVQPTRALPPAKSLCMCGSSREFRVCHRPLLKQRREEWRRLGRPPETPH